jgi:hypothetical protein
LVRVRDGDDNLVNQPVAGLVWTDLDGDGRQWQIEFGNTADAEAGSLADGVYELTATAPGGAPVTLRFHRLFGDVYGDGSVSNIDLFAFRVRFGDALTL